MIFNSFQFLWLFPIIFFGYYLLMWVTGFKQKRLNTKIGNYLLIAISYGLYMQWEPKYAFVLLGVTAITFFSALLIEKWETEKQETRNKKRKALLFLTGALLALLPLLVFKYTSFVLYNITGLTGEDSFEVELIAPLGISFFTFQAVGYLFDVYYQRTNAEHNWWDYMLFVCFFPQILSGPISKADELLPQIKTNRELNGQQFVSGLKWLLWGMFMKVAIADRLSLIVDSVYGNYQYCSGTTCLITSVMYSLQIYTDFAGYSFMAMGVGKTLGFNLINNFKRPYLACSITEFWKRWHISLTRWLTHNVYIPMGGGRCSTLRQYFNIIVTFLISGIWHGANWTFIAWGALHGCVQIIEKALGLDPKGTLNQKQKKLKLLNPLRILITFFIANLLWIFFRMPSITDAWEVICKIFTEQDGDFSTFMTWKLLLIPLYFMIVKEVIEEFFHYDIFFGNKNVVIRWCSYFLIITTLLLMGVFDAGQFIYVSF